jgi:hypothetical protein
MDQLSNPTASLLQNMAHYKITFHGMGMFSSLLTWIHTHLMGSALDWAAQNLSTSVRNREGKMCTRTYALTENVKYAIKRWNQKKNMSANLPDFVKQDSDTISCSHKDLAHYPR